MTAISANRTQRAVATQTSSTRASNPNAILSRYQSSGASAATARQDGLPGGVGSSQKMARTDLLKLKQFADEFAAAGKKHGVPPALLAAIASRESRAGSALDSRGFGDHGNGFGLMQVDKRYHSPKGGPFSAGHIDQAAGILKSYLNQVKAKHSDWPPEQQLRGAVAAYNSGPGNVQTIKNMDVGTTGNDYSNDVWARAQELAPHFGGKGGTTGSDGPSRPTAPSRPSGGADLPNVTLKEGSRGENVKTLQKSLEKLGFELGSQDGVFGPKTEQAVKRFQSKHNLEADGIVGPKTREALEKALDRAAKPKPTPQQGDSFEPGKDKWKDAPALADVKSGKVHLSQGMEGGSVRHVQKLLGIDTDGKFGPGTKKAVADFQRQHNLDAGSGMGSVGPKTLAAMEKAARSNDGGGATPAMRKLAAAGRQAALSIGGYQSQGLCATGVSKAIQSAFGFKVWGNGNQIDNNLPRDKFKQVNMSLAEALKTPGLVLTWEKTSSRLGSIYGHTAITTGDGRSSVSDFIESNTLNAGGRSGLKIFRPTL
jgi:peptidoglycan hydrolase-like protein with peptidoglycan-binding domain